MGKTVETLTDIEKQVVYVYGALADLRDLGLIECKTLTPVGIALFDQLKASGYQPARQDREWVLRMGLRVRHPEDIKILLTLLDAYQDGRIEEEVQKLKAIPQGDVLW